MISTIKNAIANDNSSVIIGYSKIKEKILDRLQKSNFIDSFKIKDNEDNKKTLKVNFKFYNNKNVIRHLKRVSKPGLRRYVGYKEIPRVLGGFGDVLISTPKGIMNGKNARREKIGGEIICEVY